MTPLYALILALLPAVVPPGGKVLSRAEHALPRLGLHVTELRVLDQAAGVIRSLAWDQEGREILDLQALLLREQDLRIEARGRISHELRAIMEATGPSGELEVMLWRRVESPDFRAQIERLEAGGAHPEQARKAARDSAEAYFRPGNLELAARLQAGGCRVTYVGGPWPLVFAVIPVERIEGWAADSAVDHAYYSFPESIPENQYAQPTLRSTSNHRRGLDGATATIKVMVQDPGHVVTSCPYLPPVTLLNTGSAASHATGVAGNICMRGQGVHFGVAPGLPRIYSGNGSGDTASPNIWNIAIQQGVSFGNCSWWNGSKGSIVGLDRFFDYTIRNFAVQMFKSNGNQGTSSDPSATSPGNGYNMISSGCFNDGNSPEWANDKMASYSSYRNPREGHQKPEVASPGDAVQSTYRTSSPWLANFGGTSSASPLTCGAATLMATEDPGLATRPEAVKAILMASAWHNVEGAAVLSDKDGAGGVHAFAATEVVRKKQWRLDTLTSASFTGGRVEYQIPCTAGNETRVVALWFSVADSARTTDVLMMDLDLMILDPKDRTVATSASLYNPFEIVAFVPAESGNYKVRLIQQRFQAPSERLALAWSTRMDKATNEVAFSGTGGLGTVMNVGFTDLYHSGRAYLAVASTTPWPASFPLPGGTVLPFGWDALSFLSVTGFPGFSGVYSKSGTGSGSIAIPADPIFRGLAVHVGLLTLDFNLPQVVQETSPAAFFTIP